MQYCFPTFLYSENETSMNEVVFLVNETLLNRRERALLRHLGENYTPRIAHDVLKPLITQECAVSLRALDWTVTNWSKANSVVCSAQNGQMVNVYHEYCATIGFWKRALFDPFKRRARIQVCISGQVYDTTLGQANFALWAYRIGLFSYVLGHLDIIESSMNKVSQRQKHARREATKRGLHRRRVELTPSPPSTCVAYSAPCRVRF